MNELPILLNNYRISRWAYEYCLNIKDDPKIREFIISSGWAYCYCYDIKDDSEVRKFIVDSYWAYLYCKNVNKNDERLVELAKKYKPSIRNIK